MKLEGLFKALGNCQEVEGSQHAMMKQSFEWVKDYTAPGTARITPSHETLAVGLAMNPDLHYALLNEDQRIRLRAIIETARDRYAANIANLPKPLNLYKYIQKP